VVRDGLRVPRRGDGIPLHEEGEGPVVNLSWRGHEALHRGRIYITHCAAKKDDSLEGTGRRVTPDLFYAATPTQRFMRRCRERGVRWAIFSDYYGVWFSGEPREWYGDDVGDPDRVTEQRFRELLTNLDEQLQDFDEIYFYHNPGRFHRLYKRLLMETALKDRVIMITHLRDIV